MFQVQEHETMEEIRRIHDDLRKKLEEEELRWRQGAKRHWYKMGERNTKYFHASMCQSKKKKELYQENNGSLK